MSSRFSFSHALELYRQTYLGTKSERTQQEYLTDLRQLGEYLTSVKVLTVQQVEHRHLEGFLGVLVGQSLTTSTRRRKLAAVRSFFRFLTQTGSRAGDPAEELVAPERPQAQLRFLTGE